MDIIIPQYNLANAELYSRKVQYMITQIDVLSNINQYLYYIYYCFIFIIIFLFYKQNIISKTLLLFISIILLTYPIIFYNIINVII